VPTDAAVIPQINKTATALDRCTLGQGIETSADCRNGDTTQHEKVSYPMPLPFQAPANFHLFCAVAIQDDAACTAQIWNPTLTQLLLGPVVSGLWCLKEKQARRPAEEIEK
jgi:hypothetical protein